jgi:hypothetical protein
MGSKKRRSASIGTTGPLPVRPCPKCGRHVSAATGVAIGSAAAEVPPAPRPEPGCYTICAYCATLLKFGQGLELLRVPPDEAAEAIRRQPLIGQLIEWRRAVIARKIAGLN